MFLAIHSSSTEDELETAKDEAPGKRVD